jgi:hypothetical protein
MNLKNILKKNFGNIMSTLGTIITVESLRIAIGEKKARLEAVSNEITRLSNELTKKNDLLINSVDKQE